MILPSKHLSQDRALLTVGARILQHLRQPKTVSALWEELPRQGNAAEKSAMPLRYDGFVLALDFLFLIGAIELHEGLITRKPV
jgi:hypothetical protein